jgi:Right handed beta helix region
MVGFREIVMRNLFLTFVLVMSPMPVIAATYPVGPTRTHTTLSALFAAIDLGPGDVVEVDGNVIYDVGSPGIVMSDTDAGAAGNPVILRGISVNGLRPLLRGGTNTIEFRSSNHVVFENFEVTGTGNTSTGTFRCIYHHAHDIVIRNVIVRDCPRHGILGADTDSGSLTVEYSEIRNSGSNGGNHAIYMSTDQIAYPGSVFRLQYSYLHDSKFDSAALGGNLIKSRSERNEIYYNWLEDAYYHELELIGPDPDGVDPAWTDATAREDSDVVGNVIVHTGDFGSVLRFGGDGTSGGRGETFGRYRFVNNTVIRRNANNDTPTIFRLFEGIESLDFHNNVIWREGASGLTLVRAVEAQWTQGPRVRGSNNWIKSGFAYNPSNLVNSVVGTISGIDPLFANLASYDLTPALGSPLLDAGSTTAASALGYELSNPLFPPMRHPPVRALMAVGAAPLRPMSAPIDIGAFERDSMNSIFASGFEE